jgi:hypothetical protein
MSLTPDYFYRGSSLCRICDKQMGVNDTGVTYHTYSKTQGDLMFCAPCAMKLIASAVQDLCRVDGHLSLAEYNKFKTPQPNLRRHAAAFDAMATHLRQWASAYDLERQHLPGVVFKQPQE